MSVSHTYIPFVNAFTHTHTDDYKVLSWESHTPGSSAGAGGPSGPHRPAPHPPPVRPALIWHSTPTLHTCVWSRLDDGNDDTVIPVGGLFFQGYSTPTPPVDRSEGDAEWAYSKILISCIGKATRYWGRSLQASFKGRLSEIPL